MPKNIKIGKEARKSVSKGVEKLRDAVCSTMGYGGMTVYIERPIIGGYVTKDGVSVAKEFHLVDQYEEIGSQMIRQSAIETGDVAGDGTTTATCLASTMYLDGVKYIDAGHNANEIKKGMMCAKEDLSLLLKSQAVPVKGDVKMLEYVAKVSANGDEELAKAITECFLEVGENGDIVISPEQHDKLEIEKSEGYTFNYGLYSYQFESHRGKATAKYDNPKVLLVDDIIKSFNDLEHLLLKSKETGTPLIIMSYKVEQACLSALAKINYDETIPINVCVTSLPDYGALRGQTARDLAKVLNTKLITSEIDLKPTDIQWEELGSLKSFTATMDKTTLVFNEDAKEPLEELLESLQEGIKNTKPKTDERVLLDVRYKRLASNIIKLKLSASSSVEFEERYDRADDAVNAVKSANEQGIVDGGGLALLKASSSIMLNPKWYKIPTYSKKESKAFNIGYHLVLNACKKPIETILKNAGADAKKVIKKIKNNDYKLGYDVSSMSMVNMRDTGIIDPVKVTKTALINAVSVASTLLTTEAFMTLHHFDLK